MIASLIAKRAALGCIALILASCRTSAPAVMVLPSGEVLRGSATTTVDGQYYVSNSRVNCYGSFDGRTVGGYGLTINRKTPVTVTCSDGKHASGDDALWSAGEAKLTFSDGKTGRIAVGDSAKGL